MNSGFKLSRRNPRTEERARAEDRAFLGRLRAADAEELAYLERSHRHGNAPAWKRMAIQRAMAKHAP